MKIARAAAAAALSVGLLLATGACSSRGSSDPVSPAVSEDAEDGPATDSGSTGDATATDVKASCEEFNTIMADLRLVDPADSDGYDDIADRAMAAQVSAPEETSYLFAPLYLIALDAGSGDDTEESMTILKDAVFAAAGECTAQGVTLTM